MARLMQDFWGIAIYENNFINNSLIAVFGSNEGPGSSPYRYHVFYN